MLQVNCMRALSLPCQMHVAVDLPLCESDRNLSYLGSLQNVCQLFRYSNQQVFVNVCFCASCFATFVPHRHYWAPIHPPHSSLAIIHYSTKIQKVAEPDFQNLVFPAPHI